MAQLTIPGIFEQAPPRRIAPVFDRAALEGWALLYTATDAGTHSGIRFMLTLEDAQKWCSSPVSSGQLHGTRWAYFYTSVANLLGRNAGYGMELDALDLSGEYDNGDWDERIAAAGCAKISLHEIAGVLQPLGVTVLTGPLLDEVAA